MNLDNIVQEIADLIADTVPTVRVFTYPPDQLPVGVADAVFLDLGEVNYQEAFAAGLAMVDVTATVTVQMSDPAAAHKRMRELLSSGTGEDRSVVDAVMAGRTLDGLSGGMVLDRADPARVEIDGEARRLVCDLHMRIPAGRL